MRPFGRKLPGSRETDTCGRSGDDRYLTFEFSCHLMISVGVSVANRGIDRPDFLK
jgi:hypothetical protein